MWTIIVLLFCLQFTQTATYLQTWPTSIQSGTSFSISDTVTAVSPAQPLTSTFTAKTFTVGVPLPSNPVHSLSICDLNHLFYRDSNHQSGWYEVEVALQSISPSLILQIQSVLYSNITQLSIRYLFIDSTFPYLQIVNIRHTFPQPSTYNQYPSYTPINRPGLSISSNDTLVEVINGFSIWSNQEFYLGVGNFRSQERISLQVQCMTSLADPLMCRVRTLYTDYYSISYIGMDVLVVRQQLLTSTFNGSSFLHVNTYQTSSQNDVHSIGPNINNSWLFFGTEMFSKTSQNQAPLKFGISTGTGQFHTTLENNMQMQVSYIYFAVQIDCGSEAYWSTALEQCQTCPLGQYVNSSNTCDDCTDYGQQCLECTSTACSSCLNGSALNQTSNCQSCSQMWDVQCLTCSSSVCLSCGGQYILNGTDCFLCWQTWTNCSTCNASTCLGCDGDYQFNGTDCFLCWQTWTNCSTCNLTTCLSCDPLYILGNSSTCDPDCSLINQCLTCQVSSNQVICSLCAYGLVITQNQCLPVCGDGLIASAEQCDDNNTLDRDGCSSSCIVQDYFQCENTTGTSSECVLTQIDFTVKELEKVEDSNQVLLTIGLLPEGLVLYDGFDWLSLISGYSHSMNASSVQYNPQTNQLLIAISYFQPLQNQQLTLSLNLTALSPNLTTVSLVLPSTTTSNQALYVYSDLTYTLAKIVKYMAMLVAAGTLVLMAVGYFGCKLQGLEAAAVVQVSGLLLVTVESLGPTYVSLSKLTFALGITNLANSKDSSTPAHLKSVLPVSDSISLVNICLVLFVVPLIVSLILKIASKTCQKDSHRIHRAWKYALGSYTYYGLLFLAYSQFAALTLSLRYFSSKMSNITGVIIGLFFATVYVLWSIASCKYDVWFGCFKKKFFKFEISQYFYLFSSIQRFITAAVIVCLSPGMTAAAAVAGIFVAEGVFMAIKKHYVLGQWKRPLFNKAAATVVSLLYVGSSLTAPDSMIHLIIPIAIIILLVAVLVVAIVASVYELKDYWSSQEEKQKAIEKKGPQMTVEEAQSMLMKAFEMKLMPDMSQTPSSSWRPLQHQKADVDKWKWSNYPILNSSLSFKLEMKENLREKCKRREESGESLKKIKSVEVEQLEQNEKAPISKFDIYDQI